MSLILSHLRTQRPNQCFLNLLSEDTITTFVGRENLKDKKIKDFCIRYLIFFERINSAYIYTVYKIEWCIALSFKNQINQYKLSAPVNIIRKLTLCRTIK